MRHNVLSRAFAGSAQAAAWQGIGQGNPRSALGRAPPAALAQGRPPSCRLASKGCGATRGTGEGKPPHAQPEIEAENPDHPHHRRRRRARHAWAGASARSIKTQANRLDRRQPLARRVRDAWWQGRTVAPAAARSSIHRYARAAVLVVLAKPAAPQSGNLLPRYAQNHGSSKATWARERVGSRKRDDRS